MSESLHISTLMLERYNLGEITETEKESIETALMRDPRLAERLADMRRSDREIRDRHSPEQFLARGAKKTRPFVRPLVWGIGAAALLLVIALPFLRTLFEAGPLTDRAKGGMDANSAELSVFLESDPAADAPLTDQTVLRAGNTVQLAYRVSADSYGVIFSIDGRAAVTMHYPYGLRQSAQLTPGKRIALDEAYTLDDAPEYEIFFFVVSNKPLDVPAVLRSAEQLARNPGTALERCGTVFRAYTVKTLTLRKE
jgi:hypothetical protein